MTIRFSIPDEVFKRAEYLAKKQGLSSSEFYVTAIKAYIAQRRRNITAMLDTVYADGDGLDSEVERAALADLPKEKW